MSETVTAAQRVALARSPRRPTTEAFIEALFTGFFELRGDRCYGEDGSILGGLALFRGRPVTVLAQGEDYYMVRPLLPENADTVQQKLALRAGDSVIIASEEIWDGKVIE